MIAPVKLPFTSYLGTGWELGENLELGAKAQEKTTGEFGGSGRLGRVKYYTAGHYFTTK